MCQLVPRNASRFPFAYIITTSGITSRKAVGMGLLQESLWLAFISWVALGAVGCVGYAALWVVKIFVIGIHHWDLERKADNERLRRKRDENRTGL